MQNDVNEVMLMLMIPEPLKNDTVDCLMGLTFISGFSLLKAQGFSSEHSQFNIREQVEGYKDVFRFEVVHSQAQTQTLLDELSTIFTQKNIRYWLTPISASGML
jgi:hypothetical protein